MLITRGGGMPGHHGEHEMMMAPLMLAMLVLVAAVAVLVAMRVPAIRRALARWSSPPPVAALTVGPTPREILDRRLAEGTIEVSDYRSRVAELARTEDPETAPVSPQVPFA